MLKKPTTLAELMKAMEPVQRETLKRLRDRIVSIVPEAEDCLSYGMPALRWKGKPLVAFQVWTHHVALYPMSGKVVSQLTTELAAYEQSKGTIRFEAKKLLPVVLLKKIVKLRMQEIEAKGKTR
jgi:uncharacterized protein YdhG (YjbR/CyaY superfamily)